MEAGTNCGSLVPVGRCSSFVPFGKDGGKWVELVRRAFERNGILVVLRVFYSFGLRGEDEDEYNNDVSNFVPYKHLSVRASGECSGPGQTAARLLERGKRTNVGPFYTSKWSANGKTAWVEVLRAVSYSSLKSQFSEKKIYSLNKHVLSSSQVTISTPPSPITTSPTPIGAGARITGNDDQPLFLSLEKYALRSANDFPDRDPTTWTLYGESENGDRILLAREINVLWPNDARWHWLDFFPNSKPSSGGAVRFRKFRFEFERNQGGNCTQLAQLKFFGRMEENFTGGEDGVPWRISSREKSAVEVEHGGLEDHQNAVVLGCPIVTPKDPAGTTPDTAGAGGSEIVPAGSFGVTITRHGDTSSPERQNANSRVIYPSLDEHENVRVALAGE